MTTIGTIALAGAKPAAALASPPLIVDNNPFEAAGLDELQLISVNLDSVSGRASVLFDMRLSLWPWPENAGVLVIDGITDVSWTADMRGTACTAWTVLETVITKNGGKRNAVMHFHPSATLTFTFDEAHFVAGTVEDLQQAPADYTLATPESARRLNPSWDSVLTRIRSARLE